MDEPRYRIDEPRYRADPDNTIQPRRSPGVWPWIAAALFIGISAAFIFAFWASTPRATEEVNVWSKPGALNPVGTSGQRAEPPVPGGTTGPPSQHEPSDFTVPAGAAPNTVVAYFDNQPLYLVSAQPVKLDDFDMVVEARANEVSGGQPLNVYVPRVSSFADNSARFYYLKTAVGQYVKVSLQKVSQ